MTPCSVSDSAISSSVISTSCPPNAVVGRMDIPWFNVHGNHDMNFKAENDRTSDETWQRIYGPPTYSFDWATAHFIVIDDVFYDGDNSYHGELTEDILTFVEADLKEIGKETLVVLLMRIPLGCTERRQSAEATGGSAQCPGQRLALPPAET